MGRRKREVGVPGLPQVSYAGPLVANLLITLGMLLLFLTIGLITAGAAYSQIQRSLNGDPTSSPVLGGFCGFVSLASLAAVGFLAFVTARIIRDLRTPLQYARGGVMDKRSIGGRNVGNWLAVGVRYIGPSLEEASALTDQQRAAAPDRSQVVQPRFEPSKPSRSKNPQTGGSYLPAERIYASQEAESKASTQDTDSNRVVFRVDPVSFGVLEPGDEVLIAHSRHLQHIYYVAHLRGGDWESYKNKQLI
jgi:hypothetical protein